MPKLGVIRTLPPTAANSLALRVPSRNMETIQGISRFVQRIRFFMTACEIALKGHVSQLSMVPRDSLVGDGGQMAEAAIILPDTRRLRPRSGLKPS